MHFKKILGIISFYILPIILLTWTFLEPSKYFFAQAGIIAERMLIFILFIKPIAVIFRSKTLLRYMPYRKELGIAIFWFAIFHAVGLIIKYKIFNINDYLGPLLITGLLGIIGLFILAITSNKYSMKKFKKNWKKLQYLAYPTLLLTLLHSAIAQGNINKFYILGGLFILLKITELGMSHNKKQ